MKRRLLGLQRRQVVLSRQLRLDGCAGSERGQHGNQDGCFHGSTPVLWRGKIFFTQRARRAQRTKSPPSGPASVGVGVGGGGGGGLCRIRTWPAWQPGWMLSWVDSGVVAGQDFFHTEATEVTEYNVPTLRTSFGGVRDGRGGWWRAVAKESGTRQRPPSPPHSPPP